MGGASPTSGHRQLRVRLERGLTEKNEGLLLAEQAEAPFADVEELQALVGEGRERGFLTFDEIAVCLEEVEVTKEQVQDLHGYLLENGIDVVSQDGKPAVSDNGTAEQPAPKGGGAPQKQEGDPPPQPRPHPPP